MTFLQPWLLAALPLVALPVIIHLIHQRRFQTVDWAAMMFLRTARAIAHGYSRLRQWLIMLLRAAAVAAVIVAMSRPLSQGWLGTVGGGGGTALVLLDRSPSMAQAAAAGRESKLATARRQLADALAAVGSRRIVLIDSVSRRPVDVSTAKALVELPEADATAAAADMPQLLEAACEQLRAAEGGVDTVWICSDQRANDWKPADPRWPAIRDALAAMPRPARLSLVSYPEPAADNRAVRVAAAVIERRGSARELLLDIVIRRSGTAGPDRVPVQIELGAARSTVEVPLTGVETLLVRHPIPLDAATAGEDAAVSPDAAAVVHGWGRVSIPPDDNPADDAFYFSFGTATARRTVVVAEDAQVRRTLELVAGIPPDRQGRALVEAVTADTWTPKSLAGAAAVLWQAALPEGETAEALSQFVARGGEIIFLPPEPPTAAAFAGVAWTAWTEHSPPLRPVSWRGDEGLLAVTLSGAALPVGEIEVRRRCGLAGRSTPLAQFADGGALLARVARDRGGVSFLTTTPAPGDSNLAAHGVVLYAAIQRAIDAGLVAAAVTRQADAGAEAFGAGADAGGWRQVAGPPAVSSEAGFHAGVFQSDGRLLAVNRSAAEDDAGILPDAQVDQLFRGLPFSRFVRKAGGLGGLVEEVWRLFLVAVLVALVAEGLLCLPRRLPQTAAGWRGREAAT